MFDVAEADFELMSWFILMSAFLVGSLIILGSSGVGKYFQTPLALLLYPPMTSHTPMLGATTG